VVCLQETKSVEFSDARCFSLWGSNDVGWIHNEGLRGVGSLIVMWHKQIFHCESHVMGTGFIARAMFEERFVSQHDFGVRLDNIQF